MILLNSNKSIIIKCNCNYLPTDEKNLIYKVVDYIYKKYNINDEIHIDINKMIPICAGLGGGSSDAATMLMFLNKHYKLNLSIDELTNIAAIFGSDVPFFMYKKPSICRGRGEIINELEHFNNYYILISTPNIRVSTEEIYNKFDKYIISDRQKNDENHKIINVINAIENKDLIKLSNNIFNDLEIVTEPMVEIITTLKERMMELGAIKSLMSGSGPTVFGIFNSYFKAINCKKILKNENQNSFIYISRPI